jgi:DNA replication protein DnaC
METLSSETAAANIASFGGVPDGMAQLERLQDYMQRLRLVRTMDCLPSILEDASRRDLSLSDFLEELLRSELTGKHERNTAMRVAMAHFPFQKSLESFDFKFQPSLDPKVVRDLATGRFIANADNVLLLGPPGVGKTHLAVALGLAACAHGYRTFFTTAAGLLNTLVKAQNENRLEEKIKLLCQPKLLVIDEIGYLPLDRQGANLFFQLISRRYERGSILVTSNMSLSNWGEIFGDTIIATAILDRLLHHSTTLNIKGESYRLKEKRRAGLLGRREGAPENQAAERAAEEAREMRFSYDGQRPDDGQHPDQA